MRFLSSILIALLLVAGASPAQESKTAPPPSDSTGATETAQKQKPYFVSPDNMLLRCKAAEFLECMELEESQCVSFITKGFAEGNAMVEADAASRSEKETSSDVFRTRAISIVAEHLHRASKGKSTSCV
jgi:hypothetical protein